MPRIFLPFAAVASVAALFLSPVDAGEPLELVSVTKIWDKAPHNAFTDLVYYQDQFVCGFREAPAHRGGVKGSSIRLIVSSDGEHWESAAQFDDPRGDIRDAKLGLLPDGGIVMVTATQLFDTSEQRHQSLTWTSKDMSSWDGPHDVGDPDNWIWGITFHEGTGYSIGYRTVDPRYASLYTTVDGKTFDVHVPDLGVESAYPNESKIVFGDDGTAYCLLRCVGPAQIGTAKAPYKDWTWKETKTPVGGPALILLPDGRLLGAGRLYDGGARTSLFWVDPETAEITEFLKLPSSGDTSYPGFVLKDGTLYMSYYSMHEGKSSIYLAKFQGEGL